jgi:hypothetical protein
MVKFIRNSTFGTYLWFFMAVYFLNCSVDAPDIQILSQQENLKFNDQESIIELLVEKVLGFENAIIEQNDVDESQQNTIRKIISLDYILFHDSNFCLTNFYNWNSNKKHFLLFQKFDSIPLDIIAPPPLV